MISAHAPGHTIDYTAGANITTGQVIELVDSVTAGFIGIAVNAIADGSVGPLAVEGIFSLPAESTDEWTEGALLYLDAGTLTDTSTDNCLCGRAAGVKSSGQTTALVLINR